MASLREVAMGTPEAPAVGSISWVDLTVPDAALVRDFYAAVTGWTPSEVPMGGYDDYCMLAPETGKSVAGVCHARGPNAGLPPQWLVYVVVADLEASLAACRERGGAVVAGPRNAGKEARYAVIRDPAGAVLALYQRLI
jgi:predicted enzyme related to lactoylglutathione lyase